MGGRVSAVAEWAIRQAQSLMGGSRSTVSAQRPMPQTILPPAPQQPSMAPVQPPSQVMAVSPIAPVGGQSPAMPVQQFATWPGRRIEPRLGWFGPGNPPTPLAPKQDVAGRAYDYAAGINMQVTPRAETGMSFSMLRNLADSLDVAKLCIETRKDQMSALSYSVLPKQKTGEMMRGKSDSRCQNVEDFLRFPDRRQSWDDWLRQLLDEMFVIDAASIYVRRTFGGAPYALELIDGATVKPLLDITGRRPEAPAPAFQQVLKGSAAVDYTEDELIYAPRNKRVHKAYGCSHIEQIVMTINIAIRREVAKLTYFTEGNVPEALISTPKEWTPDMVTKFQINWDSLMKQQANKAGLKFVPGEMNFQPTRSDGMLMGPFDEWLARVICYCFSLPPTAFVQQQNRATAESAHDTALEEGLAPLMVWVKGVMDRIIQSVFGYDDLEFVWDDVKQIDPGEERDREDRESTQGLMSIDEVRAKRGQDPVGVNIPFIMGVGPAGIMFVDDLMEAKAAGLLKIQPPAPPQQFDEYGNPLPPAAPGMPPAGAAPPQLGGPPQQLALPAPPGSQEPMPAAAAPVSSQPAAPVSSQPPTRGAGDPLAMIPPNLLAAVGLGPNGSKGRKVDVTRKEETKSDPEMAHVGHAQVLGTLRHAEGLIASRSK